MVKWSSPVPEYCQLCGFTLSEFFIDGKTKYGPWGIMCQDCHEEHGVGLGTGKGQRYDARTLEKLEG